jgi:hypothetical protein
MAATMKRRSEDDERDPERVQSDPSELDYSKPTDATRIREMLKTLDLSQAEGARTRDQRALDEVLLRRRAGAEGHHAGDGKAGRSAATSGRKVIESNWHRFLERKVTFYFS